MAAVELKDDGVVHILERFADCTAKPQSFLGVQKALASKLQDVTKQLYDLMKASEDSTLGDALPELIVANFDDEQVWQEIELQNEPSIGSLVSEVARHTTCKVLDFDAASEAAADIDDSPSLEEDEGEEESEEDENRTDNVSDDNLSGEEIGGFSSGGEEEESEEEKELRELLEKAETLGDGDSDADTSEGTNDSDLDFSFGDDSTKGRTKLKNKAKEEADPLPKKSNLKRKTVVDDQFFKLADMEKFLELEDAREERRRQKDSKDEDSSDEEEVDMFGEEISMGDEGKKLKYEDFFDPPEMDAAEEPKKKKVKFDQEQIDEDQCEDEDESSGEESEMGNEDQELQGSESDGESEDSESNQTKSTFEQRQERIKKKIVELEDASLAEKPWQLSGEVSSASRPENSLLQEHLEYEHATRQAPAVTEETTQNLEDLIRQRIKDKAWDDVERKIKPKEQVFEYKKRVLLDQEKSKMSLSAIYEQEYLKQQEKEKVEHKDPQHGAIKKMMQSLFIKLDALSNFQFTPKPSVPDVKIISNLPSITMEEVAPVSVSDAALLAPEEIKGKTKGEFKGETEKDRTDKKRERRVKRARQRAKKQKREQRQKLVTKLNPGLGNKYAKERIVKDLERQSKSLKGGVTLIKDTKAKAGSDLTSSSKFFSKLQQEVSAQVKSYEKGKKKTKSKVNSASKLKL